MSILVQLAATFGLLSLLSVGGANATIPEIYRQVVTVHHWMSDATFASLVALAQTAPGPNVLIISIIGWKVAGIAGLLTASVAIVLPSSTLAVGVARFDAAQHANAGVQHVRRALAPVAIGLMFASGVVMVRAAFTGALTLAIAISVAVLIYATRLSPLWGMAGGAIIGIAAHRLYPAS